MSAKGDPTGRPRFSLPTRPVTRVDSPTSQERRAGRRIATAGAAGRFMTAADGLAAGRRITAGRTATAAGRSAKAFGFRKDFLTGTTTGPSKSAIGGADVARRRYGRWAAEGFRFIVFATGPDLERTIDAESAAPGGGIPPPNSIMCIMVDGSSKSTLP